MQNVSFLKLLYTKHKILHDFFPWHRIRLTGSTHCSAKARLSHFFVKKMTSITFYVVNNYQAPRQVAKHKAVKQDHWQAELAVTIDSAIMQMTVSIRKLCKALR